MNNVKQTFFRAGAAIPAALAMLATGCAIHPAPREQMKASAVAIELAANTANDRVELMRAREKLGLAARWVSAGDHEPARWLAEQAEVDAQLARAKAASARALREVARLGAERQMVRPTAGRP